MEVSEEQKRRIEANRAAALARRNSKLQCPDSVEPASCVQLPMQRRSCAPQSDVIAKNGKHASAKSCPQQASLVRSVLPHANKENVKQLLIGCGTVAEKVKVTPEMCAPDRFLLVVKSGHVQQELFQSIQFVSRCENLEPSSTWPVYNLKDYEKVTEVLKGLPGVEYEQIPWSTRSVLEKFQQAAESGVPYWPGHIADSEVDQLLMKLPPSLAKTLLPFQREGVKYGLQRGGRCLIADEMGVGKTIQAIAMASCYRDEGSLLVVCPASMRLVWAEELERWLPYLSPLDVHLVFGRKDNLEEDMQLPKVVVISFNMLTRLRKSMSSRQWGMVIVDEAHNLRCTTKKLECDETMVVLELVKKVKRVALLTGTPSLSRPFDIFNQIHCLWPKLLGKNKYEFARNYCDRQVNSKDYSKGSRLLELNVLLTQAVMIRRTKDDVMFQLPPKRRQIICLQLSSADVSEAKAFTAVTARERISNRLGEEACRCGFTWKGECVCEDENEEESNDECEVSAENNHTASRSSARNLTEQEIGVAKLRGFLEWLTNNSIFAARDLHEKTSNKKMIIFAHHLKVLNSIQTIIQGKGVEYVRIDGSTLPRDRLKSVNQFRSDPKVKLAIIGVQAGGVGLDFSAARSVVFVELPKSAAEMLQAEDRAHRRGQKNSVNIYIFVAKGTTDVGRWQSLSKSLERVSTMTDGAESSLEVERVVDSGSNRLQANLSQWDSQDSCITTQISGGSPNLSQRRLSTSQLMNSGISVDFPATSLMFQVSFNTGRVHLFLRPTDETSAPISLQANFKPEDLAHFVESGICERGALPACLAYNASHREVATLFWEEYCNVRPVLRKKLRGRPVSLPLSAELESFKDGQEYDAGGVLRGGSKRRWTPQEEMGSKIPAGATWRAISFHSRKRGLQETKTVQAWTAENVPLCKYCQQPCKGPRSMKPEHFEDLFCRTTCLNEYSNKTSRRYIREELFDLEGGVCAKCALDCHALVKRIEKLPPEMRRAHILKTAPQLTEYKSMLERLIRDPAEGNAWHADHIVAVADGGGECTLENFQTLCIACHAKVTAEQHRRRTAEKLKLKKSLQITRKKLRERAERNKRRRFLSNEDDSGVADMDMSDSEDDQDLLNVKVAGSAYSTSGGGSGITEVFTDLACNSILRPPGMESLVSIHKARSSFEVKCSNGDATARACKATLQPPSEGDHHLLNKRVTCRAYSTIGGSGNIEVLSEDASEPIILQPPGMEGHESTHNVRSSRKVKFTAPACKSTLRPPSEDDQHLLNIKVAGSAYSTSGGSQITEVLTERPCNILLQPPSIEGHESIYNVRSSPEVKGSAEVLTPRACKSRLQPPIEGDQHLLNTKVAGIAHSTFGGSGIAEVLSEGGFKPILQPPSTDGHESTHVVRSSLEVKGISEVFIEHACNSILQPRNEGDQRLHITRVTGSAHSSFGGSETSEVHTERGCEIILQPPCLEGHEPRYDPRIPLELKGCTKVQTARSWRSMLQPPSKGDQDLHNSNVPDSAHSTSRASGIIEVLTERACKIILHPPSEVDEHRHNTKVASIIHSSSRGSGITAEVNSVDACKQPCGCGSDSHESTRLVRTSPYFPASGKKPTFSLLSLNKYLMGSV